ncbi:hypothetical protein [Hymenobacter sp. YC55]|uniref:hypothetical protein n=1 Tax=Hymenobacter sp. YC55 TaxID=3034019 RepID=UPI0023F6F085|nr:hypothetical protein [Hymenobacter sp. YC55]MDF7809934.1 hypothetical protein [Hymenobacter sp. YC55]
MKKSLNNEIRANLQAFADRITPLDAKPGAVPGKALTAEELQQKGITTDSHGKPLKPGQLYLAKDLPAVNHFRRLCKAYESGGWEKVELYLQPYKTPAAIARDIVAKAEATPAPVVQLASEGVPGYEQALTAHLSRNERVVKAIETYPAILAAEPAPVREFTRLTERWEKEADEAEAARVCGAECGAVVCPCSGGCHG